MTYRITLKIVSNDYDCSANQMVPYVFFCYYNKEKGKFIEGEHFDLFTHFNSKEEAEEELEKVKASQEFISITEEYEKGNVSIKVEEEANNA